MVYNNYMYHYYYQIIILLAYLWNELENCIRKESTNGQAHKVS